MGDGVRLARLPSRAASLLLGALVAISAARAQAGEATTGTIEGRIVGASDARALAGVTVDAAAPSGRYRAFTAADGRFTIVGVSPDTYSIAFAKPAYTPRTIGEVVVQPGTRALVNAQLSRSLITIARVSARGASSAYDLRDTQDVYRIAEEAAQAPAAASPSGLGAYTQGTVEGAVAGVPSVQRAAFPRAPRNSATITSTPAPSSPVICFPSRMSRIFRRPHRTRSH